MEKPNDNDHIEDIDSSKQRNGNSISSGSGDYAPPDIQKETQILQDAEYFKAQKKYLQKLDYIILPTISTLYFFEYLDRGNVAVSTSSYSTL
jgi:hypothetical protein